MTELILTKAMRELLPSDLDRLKAVVEGKMDRLKAKSRQCENDLRPEIHLTISAKLSTLNWVLERIEEIRGEHE